MDEGIEQTEEMEGQAEEPTEGQTEESSAEETQAETQEVAEEEVQQATVPEDYVVEEPEHALSRPRVIDLNALLKPISDENPSGEYLRYSGIYDEISEARREDDPLGKEDLGMDLKVADFHKVIELAVPVIENESKDVQISAWLAEALVNVHGFEGLRDSLRLMIGLLERFWETLHPEIDEGDMEGRANALAWMDKEAALAIAKAPILDGEGYGYLDYQDSKKYYMPDNLDMLEYEEQDKFKALEAEAIKLNKVTAEKWSKALSATRRAFCEELDVAIQECKENLHKLNLTIGETFDVNQAPSLMNLQKALDDIHIETGKVLKQKREEEPDEIEDEAGAGEGAENGAGGGAGAKGGVSIAAGAIQNRKDALKRLSDLADFFRKTEPHSPVSYLVTRAVKWGNMPLESWLQDVIKDETILYQIRQTLGFNTATESADGGETAAEETYPEQPQEDYQ